MLCPNDSSVIPSCLGMTLPEDNLKHPQRGGKREAGKSSWLSQCSTRSIAKVTSFSPAGPRPGHQQETGVSKGVQNQQAWRGLTLPGERAAAALEQELERAALQCPSSSSGPSGHREALLLCRAGTPCPQPQPSSLTLGHSLLILHPAVTAAPAASLPVGTLPRAALAAQPSSPIRALRVRRLPCLPSSRRHLGNTSTLLIRRSSSSRPSRP